MRSMENFVSVIWFRFICDKVEFWVEWEGKEILIYIVLKFLW